MVVVYRSERSCRVYSEPVGIDGDLFVEVLYTKLPDLLQIGSIVKWWEDKFPPHYIHRLEGEKAERALEGATLRELEIGPGSAY